MGRLALPWLMFLAVACICAVFLRVQLSARNHPAGDTLRATSITLTKDVLPQTRRQLMRDDLFSVKVTRNPTKRPTDSPSTSPSAAPSFSTEPTDSPSISPTVVPSFSPSQSQFPSTNPSQYPSMSPSESSVPSSTPTQSMSISAFSVTVHTNTTNSTNSTNSRIFSNELENIMEIFLLKELHSGLPDFEVDQVNLVLVPLREEENADEEEFILSGDLICTRGTCPATNETDAFILQSFSNNVDELLELLDDASGSMLQSVVDIDISLFSSSIVAANQYEVVANDAGGIANSPIFVPLLAIASLCIVLLATVVLLYRKRQRVPRERQHVRRQFSEDSFDSGIVCRDSEDRRERRARKARNARKAREARKARRNDDLLVSDSHDSDIVCTDSEGGRDRYAIGARRNDDLLVSTVGAHFR